MEEFFLSKQAAIDAYAEHKAKALAREQGELRALTWLTTKQAARYLQVFEDYIRDRSNDGSLQHQRVGP